ncbi:hypothetical protein D3C71_838220 [compost metagenome]
MEQPKDKIEIKLKINLADLRDLYFGKRDHILFFGSSTKSASFWLLLALVLFPFHAWYFISCKEGGVFIFGCLWLIVAITNFWSVVKPIISWRKSTNAFLNSVPNIKDLRFIYNDESILHIQDESITKLDWNSITHANISERFIDLQASTYILLPRSSMTQEEYDLLSDKIMEKVQNVTKF